MELAGNIVRVRVRIEIGIETVLRMMRVIRPMIRMLLLSRQRRWCGRERVV